MGLILIDTYTLKTRCVSICFKPDKGNINTLT